MTRESELISNRFSHLESDLSWTIKDAKRLRREAGVFMRRVKKDMASIAKENKDHRAFLENILEVNKCVDETLCKVLLAIRQNEYLQAWYPKKDA
jgi:hypothetical protein